MAVWLPRDYQQSLRDFALDHPRCQWWAGTGTGKTSAGLYLWLQRWMFGETKHLLVITTKRIATMVWPREIRRWENFERLTCAVAVGTPDQRLDALRQRAHVTCINVDNLPWLMEVAGNEWYWDTVYNDESTKLKGLRIALVKHHKTGREFYRIGGGSKRAGAVAGQREPSDGSVRAGAVALTMHTKVRSLINMTGTPSPNGLIDLWGQMWFVDAGQRLGRSFTAFQQRWFYQHRIDTFQSVLVPHAHSESEIKAAIRDVTITIEAKDYMDLPPTVVNTIKVTLPERAYRHYREMEREMFTEILGNEIEAFQAGSKSMKTRQIANGAAYILDANGQPSDQWVPVHDAKIDALLDLIDTLNGEPIIVAYYFKSDLARLQKAIPKGVYFDDNPTTLQRFTDGKIPVLFIHPKSAAHGIDGMQQVCRHVAWFSMIWELEDYLQLIERVGATRQVQSGFWRDVYVHLLIGENTIDEEMVERLDSKCSVQDAIKVAMKKRGMQ